jgi:hypothetical protein
MLNRVDTCLVIRNEIIWTPGNNMDVEVWDLGCDRSLRKWQFCEVLIRSLIYWLIVPQKGHPVEEETQTRFDDHHIRNLWIRKGHSGHWIEDSSLGWPRWDCWLCELIPSPSPLFELSRTGRPPHLDWDLRVAWLRFVWGLPVHLRIQV